MILEPRYLADETRVVPATVARTWPERFFSLPWRPWIKLKRVLVPDTRWVFDCRTFTYHGHPEALKQMRERGAIHTRN